MTTELILRARHQGGLRVLAETDRHSVPTDYPLKPGQDTAGMTSLELLLAALATCSANGVMLVLHRRLGLAVTGLEVEVRAQRREEHPTVLTRIDLHFRIQGPVFDEEAVAKAIHTAETQLCPVWVMLSAGTPIGTSFTLDETFTLS
jgi:putative redox protein